MRCRVFGQVELVDAGGRPRVLGSRNQRLVLAVLAAHRGRLVPTDGLVDTLWPDDPPVSAVSTLRTYVSRLRQHFADTLQIHPAGYSLELTADQIDVGRFEDLFDRAAAATDALTVADALRKALDLCRGPAFGGEADARLVRGEATRLDELALAARTRLAAAEFQLGRVDNAIALTEALVAEVPHHDPAWDVLVRSLTAAGRTADALRAYQRAVDAFAELGLEPSAGLRAAEGAVLSPMPPAAGRVPVGQGSLTQRGRPPNPTTELIGRVRDLDALTGLLERSRLVTVVGAGGVGKTRLAIDFAQSCADAVWVELSPVESDGDVASSVLTALGIAAAGRQSVDVLSELVDLDVLIVLDNAEHVVDGVAAVVTALLAASPRVRLLVTSRERLGVEGEYRWHVAPLVADGAELFVARAGMSDPGTTLALDDPRVVSLVQRLDSIPLAIEMAAAQLASMTIDELADELTRGLSTLIAPRRTAARQRDLSSLITWSERLLSPDELEVLHQCSVFAGGVVAADAAGVIGRDDAPTILRRLAERSLLETDRVEGGATSFRMLETVRTHTSAQLRSSGLAGATERRHAEWFLEQAEAADRNLRAGRDHVARTRFDAIASELRVAHRFCRDNDSSMAASLSTALHTQARYSMFDEPYAWAEALLDEGTDAAMSSAGVWASAAARSIARGDLDDAWLRAQRSIGTAVDDRQRMLGLDLAGDAALFDGRLAEAADLFVELSSLGLDSGDELYGVIGGVGLAMTRCYDGDDDEAVAILDRLSATLDRGPIATGWIDYTYGEAFANRDPQRAMVHYQRAVDAASASGCRFLEGVAHVSAGSLRARVGDVDVALQAFAGMVKNCLDLGERTRLRTTLRNVVVLLQRAGRPRDAAVLLGSVDRGTGAAFDDEVRRLDDARDWAVTALGDDQYESLYRDGATRDIPAAGAWALAALRTAMP